SRIGHIGWMAALVVLTACNPLTFDPQVSFPGFEVGRARITSSAPVWVEARVTGADGHAIYALGAVRHADLTGPLTRACIAAGETVPCEDVLGDVRQPDQSVLAGDGSWSRLLTVWPDEVV